ncbi:Uncharacterised protein [Mycobacterium tuberculosis]|nr:Uncharacterised protein [Mycobacterium tuberculosis]
MMLTTIATIPPSTDTPRPVMPGHLVPFRNREMSETMKPAARRNQANGSVTGMNARMRPRAAMPRPTRPSTDVFFGSAGAPGCP